MGYSSIVCRELTPLESLPLGRFVLDVHDPCEYYLDPNTEIKPEVLRETHLASRTQGQIMTGGNFVDFLTNLASVALTRQRETAARITADEATTYRIGNSDEWFKACCRHGKTRAWMEEAMTQGNEIYVVVGYHTLSNIEHLENAGDEEEEKRSPENPEQGNGNDKSGNQEQSSVPGDGEKICAVQYRKVSFIRFNSSKLDQALLDDENVWKFSPGVRGENNERNDVLDAITREDLELEDDLEKYSFDREGDFFV